MAGTPRIRTDSLTELLARGTTTSFVTLVRRLERELEGEGVVAVGLDGPPRDERIRFRHDPSLAFSASDVSRARVVDERGATDDAIMPEHVEVTTTFLGLTGSASPLPTYMTEEVAQEDDRHAPRREFLDLFHHRLLSLLYRGLARVAIDAEYRTDASDAHSKRMLALAGVDAYAADRTDLLTDAEMLRLVPLVVTRRATRHTIETAVAIIFESLLGDARIRLTAFQGKAVPFHEAQRVRLGVRNHALGVTTIIGTSVTDRASRATLTIGPVGADVFTALSPGGPLAEKLRHVLAFVTDDAVAVDVELILAEQARRELCLDRTSRLGIDSFLAGGKGEKRVRVRGAARAAGQ